MQTKLRITMLMIAAILLTASMISAASRSKQLAAAALAKPRFVGIASWYGAQHQGRKMANGKRFDRRKLTAASWYLPMGTTIRVVNLENGKSVTVTITDRGPNFRLHRLSTSPKRQPCSWAISKRVSPRFTSPRSSPMCRNMPKFVLLSWSQRAPISLPHSPSRRFFHPRSRRPRSRKILIVLRTPIKRVL